MAVKLKIGLLVNSNLLPNWVLRMLEKINNSDYAEIVVVVTNPLKNETEKINFRNTFFKLFLKIDKRIFKKKNNVLEKNNFSDFLLNTPQIKLNTENEKNEIEKIKIYSLDVFINFGCDENLFSFAKLAKYGIWSYVNIGSNSEKNNARVFWNLFEKNPGIDFALKMLSPDGKEEKILNHFLIFNDRISVIRNLQNLCKEAVYFLPSELRKLQKAGSENYFFSTKKNCTVSPQKQEIPTNREVLKYILPLYFFKIAQRITRLFQLHQWILMYQTEKKSEYNFSEFKKIIPPKDRLYADSFVIEKENCQYIFFEEMLFKENKGFISCIKIDEKGTQQKMEKIIEKPYHLSYPFVFEHENIFYMIPESADNKTIELYKCTAFPDKWEWVMNLMENIIAFDSTVFFKNNKWWLFTSLSMDINFTGNQNLCLFYSDNIFSTNWISHPLNPVVLGIEKARPAGKIFENDGKMYRPSQNSSLHYGYGMCINEINLLNENQYQETVVKKIYPHFDKKTKGIHTINFSGNTTVVDAYRRRSKF